MTPLLRSHFEQMAWPAALTGRAAELMALQQQFDQSQWWSLEQLRTQQFRQLGQLVAHAYLQVPFYRERLQAARIDPEDALTEAAWQRLPVLTRTEVQGQHDRLLAGQIPASHGGTSEATTSGSTGIPVRVRKTALDGLMWHAMVVREELWHREHPRGTIARIMQPPPNLPPEALAQMGGPDGVAFPDLGPPSSLLWQTGRTVLLHYNRPIAEQAGFLLRLRPDYLFTNPSNLRLLIAHFRDNRLSLPSLRAVWARSEPVDASLRAGCRAVFGCGIVQNYTANEVGYMALQCPTCDNLHVQSEVTLVEVLDAAGRPCAPGETGRVVVTPLHNFAMPLLRYEIGDEAELGGPCGCGRGLPVLTGIAGRMADTLTLPTGERRRVLGSNIALAAIEAIREFQIVQRGPERLEMRLVVSRPLTGDEERRTHAALAEDFGPALAFDLVYCESLPRTAAGKLRPFVSELPEAASP